jgi:hypothetical protein
MVSKLRDGTLASFSRRSWPRRLARQGTLSKVHQIASPREEFMTTLSRRDFVLSAAATSAVFGLNGPMAFVRPASAQSTEPPKFSRLKIGDIEVTQLYDGIWQKAHDPNFIKGVSVEETKKALVNGGLTDAHVPITFTITLIKMGDKTIMFDAGTGGQLAPSAGVMMRDGFQAAGIDPKSISTIVMTHFHADHLFGLMAKDTNAQIFPNAQIIVPSAEYNTGLARRFRRSLRDGRALRAACRQHCPNGRTSRRLKTARMRFREFAPSPAMVTRRGTPAI